MTVTTINTRVGHFEIQVNGAPVLPINGPGGSTTEWVINIVAGTGTVDGTGSANFLAVWSDADTLTFRTATLSTAGVLRTTESPGSSYIELDPTTDTITIFGTRLHHLRAPVSAVATTVFHLPNTSGVTPGHVLTLVAAGGECDWQVAAAAPAYTFGDALTLTGLDIDWVPDNVTLEVSADQGRIKDLGVSTAKIAAGAVTNAKLDSDLALRFARVTATNADYTATTSDCIIWFSTGNTDRTLNLPAAATAGNGRTYRVKKIDSGTGKVIINPSGAETIEGGATYEQITLQWQAVDVVTDGTSWGVH